MLDYLAGKATTRTLAWDDGEVAALQGASLWRLAEAFHDENQLRGRLQDWLLETDPAMSQDDKDRVAERSNIFWRLRECGPSGRTGDAGDGDRE